jgi:hypothetical protein
VVVVVVLVLVVVMGEADQATGDGSLDAAADQATGDGDGLGLPDIE